IASRGSRRQRAATRPARTSAKKGRVTSRMFSTAAIVSGPGRYHCRLRLALPMSAGLNLAQLDAVNHLAGPCLVLAGAGSGKTRVITHKIVRLMQAGLAAERIAAITFTNKAAGDMRERAGHLVGRDARKVLTCPFHALVVRLLREHGPVLGLKPQLSILDTDYITSLLKDCG